MLGLIKMVLVLAAAYFIGLFGWAQIVGSLQNIAVRKSLIITLVLWFAIMGGCAYFAVVKLAEFGPIIVGYGVSLFQILKSGKIE